jgi:hypothetical protein
MSDVTNLSVVSHNFTSSHSFQYSEFVEGGMIITFLLLMQVLYV